MQTESLEQQSPGWSTTLLSGLGRGGLVGAFAGTIDGLIQLLGIDSAVFAPQVKSFGLVETLTRKLPRAADLPGLFGCVTAAAFYYALLGALLGLVAGFVFRLLGRPRNGQRRGVWIATPVLGLWLFLELYWWTRPVVFWGMPATAPPRLAATAGMAVAGLALAYGVLRGVAHVPAALRRLAPIGALALVACGGVYVFFDRGPNDTRGVVNERTADLPNVLIFVVDALRDDVLGCYGGDVAETPVIDRLAREGVVFEDAFAQAPFTWTSFGSLLTGKYPRRHGLIKMAPGVRMLPNITLPYHLQNAKRVNSDERLEPGDFLGAAFMTGTLSHGSGLLRGFDIYLEAMVGHDLVDLESRWSQFRSGLLLWQIRNKVNQRFDNQFVASVARDWFEVNHDKRFVSMVHYYSTHTPYDPVEPFRSDYVSQDYDGPIYRFDSDARIAIERGVYETTEADERRIRELYYGGVAQADAMIGEVIDELEARGVLDNTIVVVTSDHGEELGEHGLWEHDWMYQTNLRIPLVMRWPKGIPAGTRVAANVDSIDLVPTICELMGLEAPHDEAAPEKRGIIDGTSLVPVMLGATETVREFSFAENGAYRSIQSATEKLIVHADHLLPDDPDGWAKVSSGEHKLGYAPRYYNLVEDPHEEQNRFAQDQTAAKRLYDALRAWSDAMPIGSHMIELSERDIDHQQMANLKALGYAGDGSGAEHGKREESEEPAADPQAGGAD